MPWRIKYVQVIRTMSDKCPYGENEKCHYPKIGNCDENKCPIKEWAGNDTKE